MVGGTWVFSKSGSLEEDKEARVDWKREEDGKLRPGWASNYAWIEELVGHENNDIWWCTLSITMCPSISMPCLNVYFEEWEWWWWYSISYGFGHLIIKVN